MEETYQALATRVLHKWEECLHGQQPNNHSRNLVPENPELKSQNPDRTDIPRPRLLIALAGAPGSGKTTIANRVASLVNFGAGDVRPKTLVISADGFHLPLKTLYSLPNAEEAIARRGASWTFDGAGFVNLVQQLRSAAGKYPVVAPTFDHAIKDPVMDGLVVDADVDICILEGNYLLTDEPPWSAVAGLVDDRWLVRVDPNLARLRVAARHLKAGIETTMEDALRRVDNNDTINGRFVMDHSGGRYDLLVESVEEGESQP